MAAWRGDWRMRDILDLSRARSTSGYYHLLHSLLGRIIVEFTMKNENTMYHQYDVLGLGWSCGTRACPTFLAKNADDAHLGWVAEWSNA